MESGRYSCRSTCRVDATGGGVNDSSSGAPVQAYRAGSTSSISNWFLLWALVLIRAICLSRRVCLYAWASQYIPGVSVRVPSEILCDIDVHSFQGLLHMIHIIASIFFLCIVTPVSQPRSFWACEFVYCNWNGDVPSITRNHTACLILRVCLCVWASQYIYSVSVRECAHWARVYACKNGHCPGMSYIKFFSVHSFHMCA